MTLAVRGLTVVYGGSKGSVPAVRCLVGLVGESGSGKTTVVRAILGLLPEGATTTGSITLDGQELVGARPGLLQTLRGRRLDASLRAGVAEVLARLRSDRGLAVVLITHDLAEAAQICDRLVVLDAGKVVEDGPSADLLSQPAAPATRALVAVARDPLARVAPAAAPRASSAK